MKTNVVIIGLIMGALPATTTLASSEDKIIGKFQFVSAGANGIENKVEGLSAVLEIGTSDTGTFQEIHSRDGKSCSSVADVSLTYIGENIVVVHKSPSVWTGDLCSSLNRGPNAGKIDEVSYAFDKTTGTLKFKFIANSSGHIATYTYKLI